MTTITSRLLLGYVLAALVSQCQADGPTRTPFRFVDESNSVHWRQPEPYSATPILRAATDTINLPTDDEIVHYGTFSGIRPISYDLQLRLPTLSDGRETVNGNASMAFSVVYWTQRLFLHARDIDFSHATATLTAIANGDDRHSQSIRIQEAVHLPEQLLMISTEQVLRDDHHYELSVHGFVSRITGAKQMGIFAGLAYAQPTSRVHTYASQFQTNYAQTIFPCIDSPLLKATFTLTVEHPPHYEVLTSAQPSATTKTLVDGWERVPFHPTPLLPTYTLGIVVLPLGGYRMKEEMINGVNIRFWYNRYTTSPGMARTLFDYCKHAWTVTSQLFDTTPLPLDKIDYVMVPDFKVQGMENWALITLNEHYLLTDVPVPTFRLSLIAHETVHQWISNMATTRGWQHLCLQEGITDYYARRITRDYFDESNQNWEAYIVNKYVSSMRLESSQIPPADLMLSAQPNIGQISEKCFGKGVFLVESLAKSMHNLTRFDETVKAFLQENKYGHFDLDGFTRHFDSFKLTNVDDTLQSDYTLGEYFRRWFTTPGYPSLTVQRSYSNQSLTITQQGLFPKARTYATTDHLWILPIHFRLSRDDLLNQGTDITAADLVLTSRQRQVRPTVPLADAEWLLVNNEFGQFYRVNYDLHNWALLARALATEPLRFLLLDRVRLINDFCFFNSIGALKNADAIRRLMLQAVADRKQLFPSWHAYTTACQTSHNKGQS